MVCEGRQECSDGGADGTGGSSRGDGMQKMVRPQLDSFPHRCPFHFRFVLNDSAVTEVIDKNSNINL